MQSHIADRYWQDEPIEELLLALSDGLDKIIIGLFDQHIGSAAGITLFAVGGYGRQELHPGSDIDLLILANKPDMLKTPIESFLRSVWDLNVEVGHAVRSPKDCFSESQKDITVATAMFERRLLVGDVGLSAKLDKVMDKPRLWPVEAFFKAKQAEQVERHKHYDDTEYNLEPNIKTSPGGLRDIHTILWICRRQFKSTEPTALRDLGVLTDQECQWLIEGKRFIWWVRFGLHLVAGRKEDRLQFSHQRELAERLGFADTDAQRGVERFMHHYYRHVFSLTEVNDIVLQYFREVVVAPKKQDVQSLNERFRLVNGYIEATSKETFQHKPSALLEMFVMMANRTDIVGVRAETIRLVRDSLALIDTDFRNAPEQTRLFIDLLKAPFTLVSQLTRMRRYGILGRYIPEFGQVIGQMQHDLFHTYTVDAHTMMVIRNMRRFRYRSSREAFPVAYHCVHNVPKIELLYIAGMYHDIGKGRGGDHSKLGAVDARTFCERHGLTAADTDLVCWLVEKHLYMSSVSQREDIYDPDVVYAFAEEVKSEMRLDYLYALTVADINATNPTLWNSWRATLMRQLYTETRRTLRRGLESADDKAATIAAYQEHALERLTQRLNNASVESIQALWEDLGEDFFLRHTPRQIAEISAALLQQQATTDVFVDVRGTQGDLPGEGATRVYVYTKDRPDLFANTVVALTLCNLSVFDASVNTGPTGMCFDVYTVLTDEGTPLATGKQAREDLCNRIRDILADPEAPTLPNRRLSRQLRELPAPTEVHLNDGNDANASVLTIIASDRPGLLAAIGEIFRDLQLQLLSARITTLGERVEDTFLIQDKDGQMIEDDETIYTLEHTIRQRLDAALLASN